MTFPTAPILDNFNRSPEGPPPGAGWITGFFGAGYDLVTANNMCRQNVSGGGGAIWNTALNANQQAYFTIADLDFNGQTNTWQIYFRIQDPNTWDNYYVASISYDLITLSKWVNGTYGSLGTYVLSTPPAIGDLFGIDATGSALTVNYKPVGGNLIEAITANDSDLAGSSYIGLEMWDQNSGSKAAAIDDFGGGAASIPAPTCFEAHVAGSVMLFTWSNALPDYDALRIEWSATHDGTFADLDLGLLPDAESAIDPTPTAYNLWYRLVATKDSIEAITDPVQPTDTIRAAWNDAAHSIGITDLIEPVAPFRYGEAGELLFLVCARLWRMQATGEEMDPVGTDPQDWLTYLATGHFPT